MAAEKYTPPPALPVPSPAACARRRNDLALGREAILALPHTIDLPDGHELRWITDDAMAPELPSGAAVIIDTRHRVASPPGMYEISNGVGREIVRLEILIGTMPIRVRVTRNCGAYPPHEVLASEITIIGRVVAAWRPL